MPKPPRTTIFVIGFQEKPKRGERLVFCDVHRLLEGYAGVPAYRKPPFTLNCEAGRSGLGFAV